jgi:hypothetical protein
VRIKETKKVEDFIRAGGSEHNHSKTIKLGEGGREIVTMLDSTRLHNKENA